MDVIRSSTKRQKTTPRLKLIQVGMGGWGIDWNRNVVSRSADFELVACVDTNPEALARAQSKLNVPPDRYYFSLEAVVETVDADAVLITAALPGHVPVALAALAAGKHVLCEKPFAATVAEAQQVVQAADEAGKILMISQNYRFFPAVHTVAQMIREQTLGTVGAVTLNFRRYANTAPRGSHKHYLIPHPLLIDMAIHHFDLMRMVLNQEPLTIDCHAWNPPWSNFVEPAAATATVVFDGDAVVSYYGNWVSTGPQTAWAGEWRVECAEGEILWTSRGTGATADRAGVDRVVVQKLGEEPEELVLPDMPHVDRAGSLAHFADCIRAGRTPESSGRDNLGSIALMNAAVESAVAHKIVHLPKLT